MRLRGETSSLGQVSSVYSRSQGLCFFFFSENGAASIDKCNRSRSQKCAHSGAGKEMYGTRQWIVGVAEAVPVHHQTFATDCLSHAKFSFPESRKGRHHQSTTQHKQRSRTCTCAQCKHVPGPGWPCLVPGCPVPRPSRYDTTPTHGQWVITGGRME